MTTHSASPSQFPLPPSPPDARRASIQSTLSVRSSASAHSFRSNQSAHSTHSRSSSRSARSTAPALRSPIPLHLPDSPKTAFRPRFDREDTSVTVKQFNASPNKDSFYEGATISVNQPVGSLSISPSSRDVCLASRKGLYILDIANLNNAPRFIAQGGTWQIADCQWSPHPATSHLILSTSSQKLLMWDLLAQKTLSKSIDAHARAITDINWHARNPNLMATVSMDAGIRGWDLRAWDRPFMRVCAWTAGGTQVKWNRQHDHWVATAHGEMVYVWDDRKGSVPVVEVKAHDSKIYGIDWDREHRHKLVTCSLDKTIKYWSFNELAPANDQVHDEYHDTVLAPNEPVHTISTSYPVWRARNLPFGHGVLSLPQRGTDTLDMFSATSSEPVETFEGHDNVVKEFVWRSRGGEDPTREDREFQLITWSKDRTLRIWPVSREVTERVGYKYGAPIKVLHSRRGAADITYTRALDADERKNLPLPVVNPSGIARQKMAKAEVTMTRGGGQRAKGMDQLEWLTKVTRNKASPDSSTIPSRVGSMSRTASRGASAERIGERGEFLSLKDEVVLVNKIFPRPKIKFEKIDLNHRKLTMTMNGPWANGDRMAFIRIHWSFPAQYPYVPELPSFELERNPTVSPITRAHIVNALKALRMDNRQCLVSTCGFLLGSHERIGRKEAEEESDSDNESQIKSANVVMLIRTCGATFGPNGQLVCFFPKQTVLPRTKHLSRSPSASRDAQTNPLLKAMSALSRVNNPHGRNAIRNMKSRLRRLDIPVVPTQSGSTLTLHDVSHLGNPDAHLARMYGMSLSPDQYLLRAFEAKRLDHAEVWATLKGLFSEQPPPPYSALPPPDRDAEVRRDREAWERGMARKKLVLNQLFERLMQNRDVQLLALVACILLKHAERDRPPPRPELLSHRSPEQDYFALPRHSSYNSLNHSNSVTPMRKVSRASITPISPGFGAHRNSGWSQHLNASSLSLRGHITPNRSSFDVPRTTPGEPDDASSVAQVGLSIPVPGVRDQSPRWRDRPRMSGIVSASPTAMTPYKVSGSAFSGASTGGGSSMARVGGSGDELKPLSDPMALARHIRSGSQSLAMTAGGSRVTFGSNSPLRRNASRMSGSTPATIMPRKKNTRVCGVRIEMPEDETEPPELLDAALRVSCEGFKLAYADYLLRCGLYGLRATLLQFSFTSEMGHGIVNRAASGGLTLPVREQRPDHLQTVIKVCVACASISRECPSCRQTPVKPLCAYCRLPIKGLATSCAQCSHRTHARCFRAHFSGSASSTCPACLCHCVLEGGISGRPLSAALHNASSAVPTSTLTRGNARGSITPLSPGKSGTGRMTYASLKTIREQDQTETASALGFNPDGKNRVSNIQGQLLSGGHDGGSGWLGWDATRIGWPGALAGGANASGDGSEDRGRVEGRRRVGPFRSVEG